MENKITKQEKDFAKWYQDVCEQAKLIIYSPVKGTVIFEPYSFAIWELIQKHLDLEFKKNGVLNVSMPMLIPESFLEKEKKHIEGFAPEVYTVTKIGKKELKENLIIRPTSETLFAYYFKQRLQSYKQLPMILNQWVSVLRSETNTKPFLRTSEFLWQEGHTCHETKKDAEEYTKRIWNIYNDFINNKLAIATVKGKKTETEKFAGAEDTYTIETLMKDGQALQSCTSHYLGQNFSKSFDIKFLGKENKQDFPHQTSWGISTRIIGAIIMNHGDDNGLVLPPAIAPYQMVILELFGKKNDNVRKASIKISKELENDYRVFLDDSDKSMGFKSQEWEAKGVPIRIEVGPRELEKNNVVLVNRVTNDKKTINIKDVKKESEALLIEIEKQMFKNSKNNLKKRTVEVKTYAEFKKNILAGNMVVADIAWSVENENKIKEETGATTRCILDKKTTNKCFLTSKESTKKIVFARAY